MDAVIFNYPHNAIKLHQIMNKEKEMQATDLQRFIEETSNVCIRAQVINGQPWFVAKDICLAIGISQ